MTCPEGKKENNENTWPPTSLSCSEGQTIVEQFSVSHLLDLNMLLKFLN